MSEEILEILNKIEDKGFEAYIVGGYVRDGLLNNKSFDVDICTNATPKDLLGMFNNVTLVEEYGAVKVINGKYNIDITTFRKRSKYKDGHPVGIEYTNSLKEDLKRRDFTINTICLDSMLNVIDYEDGIKDIRGKLIRTVGKASERLEEDPTRILRALRFMATLGFDLDKDIEEYIINNPESLKNISVSKKKSELNKVFVSNHVYDFIKYIKSHNLEEGLGIKFNKIKKTNNLVGMWAQVEVLEEFHFTKTQIDQITKIRELVNKGNIDKYDIYKMGSFICVTAAQILGKNTRNINKIFDKLPIHEKLDIDIKPEEICQILEIEPSKELGDIINLLEKEILDFKLQNKYDLIVKRLNKMKVKK